MIVGEVDYCRIARQLLGGTEAPENLELASAKRCNEQTTISALALDIQQRFPVSDAIIILPPESSGLAKEMQDEAAIAARKQQVRGMLYVAVLQWADGHYTLLECE